MSFLINNAKTGDQTCKNKSRIKTNAIGIKTDEVIKNLHYGI